MSPEVDFALLWILMGTSLGTNLALFFWLKSLDLLVIRRGKRHQVEINQMRRDMENLRLAVHETLQGVEERRNINSVLTQHVRVPDPQALSSDRSNARASIRSGNPLRFAETWIDTWITSGQGENPSEPEPEEPEPEPEEPEGTSMFKHLLRDED